MLTSRRPDTLRLYDFNSYWRKTIGNFTTIPQYFKEHGYQTYSIGKVFHPGASSNFNDDYPFSWTNETFHASTEKYMNDAVCIDQQKQTYQRNLICPVIVEYQPEQSLPDIQSMNEAKRIINNIDKTKPFFIAIGIHKPHIPFRFPSKYLQYHDISKFMKNDFNYKPYGMPTVAWNPFNDIRRRDDVQQLNISFPFGPIPATFAWKTRQSYYSSVTYIDHLIGDLVKSVNDSNTIIVLTSDHGYSLGEHAEWAKYSNYEIGVRVPLIIYSPDFQQQHARKVNEIVELVDLFPTIVDLVAMPPIKKCNKNLFKKQKLCTEGKSLLPYIFDHVQHPNISNNFAISQYPRPQIYPSIYPNSDEPRRRDIKIMGYSIRTTRFRYTIWLEFNIKNFKRSK